MALLVATPAVDLDGIYTQWRFWSYLVVHIHNRDPLFSFLPIYSNFGLLIIIAIIDYCQKMPEVPLFAGKHSTT